MTPRQSPLLVKVTLITRGKQEVDHFDHPPELETLTAVKGCHAFAEV